MGVACKPVGVSIGISLTLGFVALMVVGIVEREKFEPFYRDIECLAVPLAIPILRFGLPQHMLPIGAPPMSPPNGLLGSILNTTLSCWNPNHMKITIKKGDFESTLLVPNLSKWVSGVSEKHTSSGKIGESHLMVASSHLRSDYILPALGKGTSPMEITANTSIAPLAGIFQAVLLSGYVPLYTKTIATPELCVKLFGIEFCEKRETITWCGLLVGICETQDHDGGMKAWVPGLCAYTKTICRLGAAKGEAEMKTLVTAENLGVSTIDLPCPNQHDLPHRLNCSITQAPGINASLHQVQILEFVDGPIPETKDLDDSKFTIVLVTTIILGLGNLGMCFSGCFTGVVVRRWFVEANAQNATPAIGLPSILQMQPICKKRQSVGTEGDLADV